MPTEVLIAGAGPTGLVLAIWLTRQGVKVRVIDKASEPGTTSRALGVQARTLELYRPLGLTEAVLARAHQTPAVNLWVRGRRAARVAFRDIGRKLTAYPFLLMFPQDEHETLLIDRLAGMGVRVERDLELVDFEDRGDCVRARLLHRGGSEETCEAAYIAGCDGARSRVRETLGTGFPGGTYRQVFYVADVDAEGTPINGELHVDLDEADFLAVFPLTGDGRARVIGTVRDARADDLAKLRFEDVSGRAIENLKLRIKTVNWFSTYHVHHRVTEAFRKGRAFLVGDAAHIHSPAGAQGMNTGIGDAINLAWKLAAVIQGRAPDGLLDSYQAERKPFAQRLVATTDRVFSFATAEGRVADVLRTRVAPVVGPAALRFEAVREFMFRTISQVTLNYRGGPLASGRAGAVQGGDRLPWVPGDGGDNYEPLNAIAWQVHVYGDADPGLAQQCAQSGLPLHAFAWREACAAAGLARNAAYLVRPDGYVAVVEPAGDFGPIGRFLAERGLRAS